MGYRSAIRSLCITALILGLAGSIRAQNEAAPAPPVHAGFEIRSASVYGVYYSSSLPTTGGFQAGAVNLPSDVGVGASATLDWTKFTDRSSFSLAYTSSYTGRIRYSSLDALNHNFSLTTGRKIAPRWTFRFSLSGDLSNLEQSVFAPTTLGNVASMPATFEQLSTAILSPQFANNPQLVTTLATAPLPESAVRTLLYGERMFSAGIRSWVSYSYSPRLSVTFSLGGNRSQHLSDNADLAAQNAALIPNTTSGTATVEVSYAVSPRTEIGGTVTTTRTSSSLTDLYTTISQASLGRTMGRRWFWQVRGGTGVANPTRQTAFTLSTTPRPVLGGSLGIKTFANTLLASYDRTTSDQYGLGAATSSSANGTWRWGRPGARWWLDSSLGWQLLQGNSLTNTSGWHTAVGFNHALGPHLAFRIDYAYLKYSGGLASTAYNLSQSAIRVSLVWNSPASLSR